MAKDYVVNEQGHTSYPKWVNDKEGKAVIAATPEDEVRITGKKPKADGWGKPEEEAAK